MLPKVVLDLFIILAAGLAAGLICKRLHVSVLVGYLCIGALIGSSAFAWVTDKQHEIEYIAEAGVFLLLFSIGLEFSLEELLKLGGNLIIGGSVQMLLVAAPISILLMAIDMDWRAIVLLSSAASFSSTVLIFKTLVERGQSAQPHGRRAIGILLFQDAALIPLLLLVPLLTGSEETASISAFVTLAITSLLFVVSVVITRRILSRFIIPLLAGYRSPDLVVLLTLVSLGGITLAAYSVGLPPAIGAFTAGLVFSGNRWTHQIDALVLPFRESFTAVFFVSLGLLANLSLFWREPKVMLSGILCLLVVKFAGATIALRLTGLKWRASVGMGVGLAHVGEFAFVLVLLGWESNVIDFELYQRLVTLAISSLILTPMLLEIGLRWASPTIDVTDQPARTTFDQEINQQAVVIGAGPTGKQMASRLEIVGKSVCLIDYSPINLQLFAQQGFRTVAGDATTPEILELADADKASMVIVCVSDDEIAIRIVKSLRAISASCFILVRCRYQSNVTQLERAGANQIVSEEAQANSALMNILDELTSRDLDSNS